MGIIPKHVMVAGLAFLLTGTGSFSHFDAFKAKFLGTTPQEVQEVQTDVEIVDETMTAISAEPIQTGDATSSVTLTNELNGQDSDQNVTVTETTGGQTVTVVYPVTNSNEEEIDEPQSEPQPSSMFARFKARFSF